MKYTDFTLMILFLLPLISCEKNQKSVKASSSKSNTSLKKFQPSSESYVLRSEPEEEYDKEEINKTKEIRVKNIELEELGYELWNFQNQSELCHACPAHLRLRLIEDRNIWIKVTDELGQYGEAPMLLKAFEFKKNIYLIIFSWFEGQGAIEGSHFVYKLDPKKYSIRLVGKVYLSHFKHFERGGTGWKTYYKIMNDKIVFTKLGYTDRPSPQNTDKNLDDKLIFERIKIEL